MNHQDRLSADPESINQDWHGLSGMWATRNCPWPPQLVAHTRMNRCFGISGWHALVNRIGRRNVASAHGTRDQFHDVSVTIGEMDRDRTPPPLHISA